jgi:hypothetical protein
MEKYDLKSVEQILKSWNVEIDIIKRIKELNGKLPKIKIDQSYLEYFCSFIESRGYHDFYESFKMQANNWNHIVAFYFTLEKLSTSFHTMHDKSIISRGFKVK